MDLEEEVHIPSMLSVLPKLPYNNVKYISAALKMIGKFLALTMFLYCGQDQRKSILIALWIIFLIYIFINIIAVKYMYLYEYTRYMKFFLCLMLSV